MRVIIGGSRTITDPLLLRRAIEESGFPISEVVSGGATGVDALGEAWATAHNIPCTIFQADWEAHGRAAGPIRNQQMIDYAEAVIALWDGSSRGTGDLIARAAKKGLRNYVLDVATNGP